MNMVVPTPHANVGVVVSPSAFPSPLHLVDVFEGDGREFPKPDQVVGEHQSPAAIQLLQVPSKRRTVAGASMLYRESHQLRQRTSGPCPVASRGGLLTLLLYRTVHNSHMTLSPSKLPPKRECSPNGLMYELSIRYRYHCPLPPGECGAR